MPTATKTSAKTSKGASTKAAAARSKGAGTSTPDAIDLLIADHREVKALFKEYDKLVKAEADAGERQVVAAQICVMLTAHATAEEELFYPAAREVLGDDEDLVDEADVEHASAKESDQLLERLHAWGVRRVFGYPGDGINGLMGAFDRIGERMEFIQARHEELAAFMATAHAKFTGEVGVCMATSGPGAIHLLNGLYDAKARPPAGGGHRRPAGAYRARGRLPAGSGPAEPVQGRGARVRARGHGARAGAPPGRPRDAHREGPAHASPASSSRNDLQELDAVRDAAARARHGAFRHRHAPPGPWCRPKRTACSGRSAERRQKVAILAGAGALHATDELVEVAELLGPASPRPCSARRRCRTTCPSSPAPSACWAPSPAGTVMNGCDTLLMVGTSFPYSEFLPKEGQARGVQIDLDGRKLRCAIRWRSTWSATAAHAAALLPLLTRKADRSWREQVEQDVRRWWEVLERAP
jgi:pyruvate dehydrogenase (quinone)